jgi:plastocyanin
MKRASTKTAGRRLATAAAASALVWTVLGIGNTAVAAAGPTTVTLNLVHFSKIMHGPAGAYVGVSPGSVRVHVGDQIVFANDDAGHHTATLIPTAAKDFPANPRFTDAALKNSGNIGDSQWSTGDIAPGRRSAPLIAKKPGTYLYGCFYDYSAGMRGVIVVEP